SHPDATVVGVDPSQKMLAIAAEKAARASAPIAFHEGDAQSLDFPNASFDGVTMAFGIRNVPDRPRALREMARVTRRGGRVAILELAEPRRGPLGALARFHIHTVVPAIGGALSGAKEYSYLQRSIAAFPPSDEFAAMMEAAGLEVLRAE